MSDQAGQDGNPAGDPPVVPPTDQGAIIDTLTAQIREKDALIEKLRGVEKDLKKKADRGERFEGVIRGQIDGMKEGISEGVAKALEGLPLEKQLDLLPLLKSGAQPAAGDPPAAPAPPGAPPVAQVAGLPPAPTPPPAPPPPAAGQLASAYEVEKQRLVAAGNWNQHTARELARKHSTAID